MIAGGDGPNKIGDGLPPKPVPEDLLDDPDDTQGVVAYGVVPYFEEEHSGDIEVVPLPPRKHVSQAELDRIYGPEDRPSASSQSYFEKITDSVLRIVAKFFSPAFPGFLAKWMTAPPQANPDSNPEAVESESGARVKIKHVGDSSILVRGGIYDVASFMRPLLQQEHATLAPLIDWSLGSVVEYIRNIPLDRPNPSFGSFRLTRDYNPETGMYEVTIDSNLFSHDLGEEDVYYRALVEAFTKKNERELEELVFGKPLSSVASTLRDILKSAVSSPDADRVIKMLNASLEDERTIESEGDRGAASFWSEAGIRLAPDGQILAIVIKFSEGKFGIPGVSSFAEFEEENKSTFTGTPSADGKSIVWEVSDTNSPPYVFRPGSKADPWNSAYQIFKEFHFETITKLFGGDVEHIWREAPSTPPEGRGSGNPNTPPAAGGGGGETAGSDGPPKGAAAGKIGSSLAAEISFMDAAKAFPSGGTMGKSAETFFGEWNLAASASITP